MGVLNLDDFTRWITWAASRQTVMRHADTIEPLHLLACVVHDDTAMSGAGWQVPPPWALDGVDVPGLRADLDAALGPFDRARSAPGSPRISAEANDLVGRSVSVATGLGRSLMTPDLLLVALLEHPDVARTCAPRRLTAARLRTALDPPEQGPVATLPVPGAGAPGALGEAARRDFVSSYVGAQARGAAAVRPVDLLVVLLGDRRAATRLLAAAGVDALLLRSTVEAASATGPSTARPLAYDRAMAAVLTDAAAIAIGRGSPTVAPAHLLPALFRTDRALRRDLRRAGLGLRALEQAVDRSLPTGDLLLPRGAHPDAALVEGLDATARATWVRGQDLARLLQRPQVDSEHLFAPETSPAWLLAALREDLGVDVELVARQCSDDLAAVPLPGVDSPLGILPLTTGARSALQVALRLALDRGADRADAGDLLVGLLTDRGGLPARLLAPRVPGPDALHRAVDVRRPA